MYSLCSLRISSFFSTLVALVLRKRKSNMDTRKDKKNIMNESILVFSSGSYS